MPRATLKEKGQITLPATIRRQLRISIGTLFNIEVVDNKIVMTMQKVVPASATDDPENARRDLSQWIGAKPGVFHSPADADAYIQQQRDAWD